MEGKISFNSICEQFKKQILIFVTHYRKMTWAVVLGKAVILPVRTSDWLFKALSQSYVSSLLQLSQSCLMPA